MYLFYLCNLYAHITSTYMWIIHMFIYACKYQLGSWDTHSNWSNDKDIVQKIKQNTGSSSNSPIQFGSSSQVAAWSSSAFFPITTLPNFCAVASPLYRLINAFDSLGIVELGQMGECQPHHPAFFGTLRGDVSFRLVLEWFSHLNTGSRSWITRAAMVTSHFCRRC